MKIGVIGNGYVGGATALLKNRSVEALIYDIDPDKCSPRGISIDELSNDQEINSLVNIFSEVIAKSNIDKVNGT